VRDQDPTADLRAESSLRLGGMKIFSSRGVIQSGRERQGKAGKGERWERVGKGTFVPSVLDGKVEGDHSSRVCAGLAD